jgi:hypothetical protein
MWPIGLGISSPSLQILHVGASEAKVATCVSH